VIAFFRWVLSIFQFRTGAPKPREIPLLLAKCTVWGLLSGPFFSIAFILMDEPAHLVRFLGSPYLILISSLCGVVWGLSFYIILGLGNTYLKQWMEGTPKAIANSVFVLFNLIGSTFAFFFAGTVSALFARGAFTVRSGNYLRYALVDAVFGAILAIVIRAFLHLKIEVERTQHQLRKQELETARAQSLALQSQINPHFFFNTLNTISALIDDDPAAARRNIGRLADLFRYTLSCTHTTTVDLDQELDFVRDYLAIEQERFRRRLRLELPDSPTPGLQVPGLILQPLVENAIKHGIAPRIDGGTVSIRVEPLPGGTVSVTVRNTSDGEPLPDHRSLFRPGHALENVRARLRMFTGQPDPLRMAFGTSPSGDGWTEFGFEFSSALPGAVRA
jgi:sensor histidine kinase YesM